MGPQQGERPTKGRIVSGHARGGDYAELDTTPKPLQEWNGQAGVASLSCVGLLLAAFVVGGYCVGLTPTFSRSQSLGCFSFGLDGVNVASNPAAASASFSRTARLGAGSLATSISIPAGGGPKTMPESCCPIGHPAALRMLINSSAKADGSLTLPPIARVSIGVPSLGPAMRTASIASRPTLSTWRSVPILAHDQGIDAAPRRLCSKMTAMC